MNGLSECSVVDWLCWSSRRALLSCTKKPRPSSRSFRVDEVGRGCETNTPHCNRKPGFFVIAIEKFFSFREDWHQDDRANPLVRQYQTALDSVLKSNPRLRQCVAYCIHCRIRFLTHPRCAGRVDLRCPFGCRQHHRQQRSNERSAAYYQTASGKRKKKRLNARRTCNSSPVVADEPRTDASEQATSANEQLPDELSRKVELRLEGVVLRESTLLKSGMLPYVRMIVSLMRVSTDKTLGILEQARFIADLLTIHGMSLADIAETLSRSKAWVSMRRNLLDEMSQEIQQALFCGAFPVYCYMYTLGQFRRMNSVTQGEIERFVKAVAGKRLSVRDIELLAHGYFRGPDSLREAIDGGKLGWSLDQMKSVPEDLEGCNEFERVLLKDLQILQKYMQRVMTKCHDQRPKSRAFRAQVNLLTGALLSNFEPFCQMMRAFHDRSGQA